jgi:hypothetical protein
MTIKQIRAVKYMIFMAKEVTPLTKGILSLLIDESKKMTRSVCLTLTEGVEGFTAEEIRKTAQCIGYMQSCGGRIHIDQILLITGSGLQFSFHYGDYDPTRKGDPFSSAGQFAGFPKDKVFSGPDATKEGMLLRYTFWLAHESYSRKARLVTTNRNKVQKVIGRKSGLYTGK